MKLDINRYNKPDDVGGFTDSIEGKNWILWEHKDGSIYVSRTNGFGTGVTGEMVKLENINKGEV